MLQCKRRLTGRQRKRAMLPQASRKNTHASCGRTCRLSIPRGQRCNLSAAFVVYIWIMTTEAAFGAITNATCEQTYGFLGSNATLRCAYEPVSASVPEIHWKKGSLERRVYVYVENDPNFSGPEGEFQTRTVTTTDGVIRMSAFLDMHIHQSILTDEDTYKCDLLPKGAFKKPVPCPRLALRIPPSMFNLSYVEGGSSISIPEKITDCTTGGITIKTNGTSTLKYVTASRPNSTIIWNQVTDGSRAHTPLSDNTIQTTFEGDVTVKQGDTKLVKFTITSQNPDFTAGLLVKEACITLHREGPSPPVSPTGELVAIILGSLAAVALISGGVALAMWKMRLACWKNTALTH